jgi:hypothetical protein
MMSADTEDWEDQDDELESDEAAQLTEIQIEVSDEISLEEGK